MEYMETPQTLALTHYSVVVTYKFMVFMGVGWFMGLARGRGSEGIVY